MRVSFLGILNGLLLLKRLDFQWITEDSQLFLVIIKIELS